MESRRGFFLAIETYLDLAQRDSSFLQRGSHLCFKRSLHQCFLEFQVNSSAILGILAWVKGLSQEEQEAAVEVEKQTGGTKNSGETLASADKPTERDLWHLSTQNLVLAERDRSCGSFLLENANFQLPLTAWTTRGQHQNFSSQAVLFFQQAAEKSIKALWLLQHNNAGNLLNSVRRSTRAWEKSYYISHDLVVLAKGLMRGNFLIVFLFFCSPS